MQQYDDFEKMDFASNYLSKNPIIRFVHSRFFAKLSASIADISSTPRTVLEVGGGEGFSTAVLRRCFPEKTIFISSDLILELVKRNKGRSGIRNLLAQDISRLAVKSRSVDLVIALEVLEHLSHPESAVRELARVTRTWAILSVPFEPWWRIGNLLRGSYWNEWGNTPDHRNHWGKGSFSRLLSLEFSSVRVLVSFPWLIAVCKDSRRKERAT